MRVLFFVLIVTLSATSGAFMIELSPRSLALVALATMVCSAAYYRLFLAANLRGDSPAQQTQVDAEWVTRARAAELLGVGAVRVGILIRGEYLVESANSHGDLGVTGPSIERYLEWRSKAGWPRRLGRALTTPLRML